MSLQSPRLRKSLHCSTDGFRPSRGPQCQIASLPHLARQTASGRTTLSALPRECRRRPSSRALTRHSCRGACILRRPRPTCCSSTPVARRAWPSSTPCSNSKSTHARVCGSRYGAPDAHRCRWYGGVAQSLTFHTGALPALSWLEPRYYELLGQPATDQHPNHDVSEGDALIKHVYDVLRASPQWNDTLLIVTYDEHGGFFDHVQPPNAPAPDDVASVDPPFDFTRVGVRIPTVMASPRIKKGTIVGKPGSGGTEAGPTPTSEFEASSMVATLRRLFNLPGPPLSNRSAWAGTFEQLVANAPRTDCPRSLPTPPVHRAIDMVPLVPFAQMGSAPLNELQQVFAQTFGRMTGETLAESATEAEGAAFVATQVNRILGRNVAGRTWPSQLQRVPYQ
eukprot:m.12114 g.12114  ORF g.12114 m.12114 type:complete len:394 (-) comp9443_c0_seq1:157-1338(-)